jgi:hypothetical protein
MNMTSTDIVGVAGATLVLIGFILVQTHRLRDEDIRYDLLNAVGSALLLWYAYLLLSYPFMILNSVWLLVSLKDVLTWWRRGVGKKNI